MDTSQLSPSFWQQHAITISTIVIAIATVAYVIYSFLLWKTTRQSIDLTRKIFEATNRPYVGVGISKATGKGELIHMQTEIKNFGTSPAIEVRGAWETIVDGKPLPTLSQSYTVIVLLPQATCQLTTIVNLGEGIKISDSSRSVEIHFNLTYKGRGQKEFYYREQQRFDHEHHTFIKISGDAN